MAKLVSKSGTKSVVWDFFGLELGKDGKPVDDGSAICRSCRKRVLAKHGNTSNLLAHLRTNQRSIPTFVLFYLCRLDPHFFIPHFYDPQLLL